MSEPGSPVKIQRMCGEVLAVHGDIELTTRLRCLPCGGPCRFEFVAAEPVNSPEVAEADKDKPDESSEPLRKLTTE